MEAMADRGGMDFKTSNSWINLWWSDYYGFLYV